MGRDVRENWQVTALVLFILMVTATVLIFPAYAEPAAGEFIYRGKILSEAGNQIVPGAYATYYETKYTPVHYPWSGYSNAGWTVLRYGCQGKGPSFDKLSIECNTGNSPFEFKRTVAGGTAYEMATNTPRYRYIHIIPPKGWEAVSARSLNSVGTVKVLDKKTIFFDAWDLPPLGYDVEFIVKPYYPCQNDLIGSPSISCIEQEQRETPPSSDHDASSYEHVRAPVAPDVRELNTTGLTPGGIHETPFLKDLLSIPQAILSLVGIAPELSPEDGTIVDDQKIRDSVSVSGISPPPPDANGQAVAGNDPSGGVQVVVLPGSAGSVGDPGSKIVSEPEIVIRDSGAGMNQLHMIDTPTPVPLPALPPAVVITVPTTSIASQPEIASPASLPCPGGYHRCFGMCTDLMSDPSHCGSCNGTCASGTTCASGVCSLQCSAGRVSCGGTCADLNNDPYNCGSCGHGCISGVSCTNGQCVAQVVTTQATRLGGVRTRGF